MIMRTPIELGNMTNVQLLEHYRRCLDMTSVVIGLKIVPVELTQDEINYIKTLRRLLVKRGQ